jgi:hypothetical protein
VFWVFSENASSAGAYSGYREGVEYGALLREILPELFVLICRFSWLRYWWYIVICLSTFLRQWALGAACLAFGGVEL